MATATGPQVLVPPLAPSVPSPSVPPPPNPDQVLRSSRETWQTLRLFGRGRHPGSFKSGAEQTSDL
jgi:hypothetical protein